MASKYHPTPLSGGDRKALAKELGKARAMANILAAQSAEMRAKGEAMIQQADRLLCESWNERMWSDGNRGRTVTLKVKFNDFETITRSRSVPVAVSSHSHLKRLSVALLQNEMPVPKPVRLLGVSLSALQSDDRAESQLGFPI
ncbi:nucleotidyltransferase/DNA polymerase involved in DNA repair [Bradyrhizobium sp. F1.4.3]|uniref:DinB/UmuC family translesion DNA polymerase n=1 Tax=Bradyrhizobium sp. F1.4.3 TaxID=3156356 RepID=UPI003392E475